MSGKRRAHPAVRALRCLTGKATSEEIIATLNLQPRPEAGHIPENLR